MRATELVQGPCQSCARVCAFRLLLENVGDLFAEESQYAVVVESSAEAEPRRRRWEREEKAY